MKRIFLLLMLLIINPVIASAETLFDSNDKVNNFLISYNKIADEKINKKEIERGNIDTKALIYREDYSFEIIYVDSLFYENFEDKPVLTISISAKFDADQEAYFNYFRNSLMALGVKRSEEELREIFDKAQTMESSGINVEYLEVDKIRIEYVSSGKHGSWNTDQRIEIFAPIEKK